MNNTTTLIGLPVAFPNRTGGKKTGVVISEPFTGTKVERKQTRNIWGGTSYEDATVSINAVVVKTSDPHNSRFGLEVVEVENLMPQN